MACGENRILPARHKFNYANAKVIFNQNVGYWLQQRNCLHIHSLRKKEDIEEIIREKKNNESCGDFFDNKCLVVNENGKDILCQVDIMLSNIVKLKQLLSTDELFDILFELHTSKHYLRKQEILEHCSNLAIPDVFVNILWKSCETCRLINVERYFKFPVELNILEMSQPDGNFTNILMFIEKNTNFVLLRPIESASKEEVTYELLTILSDFGPPSSLQCNNALRKVLKEDVSDILKSLAPPFDMPIVTKGPPHKINLMADKVTTMLQKWMKSTRTSNWALGVHFVQWMINSNKIEDTYIRSKVVIGPIHSPYHAIFGIIPHTDIVKIDNKPLLHCKASKEKKFVDCSQCNLPVYKVHKCHFCLTLCHFSCCTRYVDEIDGRPTFVNKCVKCVNNDNFYDNNVDEEMIVGT